MAAKNAPTYVLAEKGPVLVYHASQPSIGLLNANPFRMGIANLGSQMIADSLLKAGFNVEFGFADTDVGSGPFVAGFTSPTDCPVLAISVPFEDTYHHVPRMLRSCGLRTRASERSQEDPVVVAGGMALINPMPLSPFVDVVVLGEGRETLVEICRAVVHARQVGIRKPDILRELAGIAHVYVPSLYQFMFDRFGGVTSMKVDPAAPGAVSPARTLDMTQNPISSIWTTPRACYEHNDYFSMMVAMGCHKKCPFCVVGSTQGEQSGRALNIGPSAILDLAERRRSQWGTRLIKLFFASSFSEVASIDPLDLRELLEMMLARDFSVRVGSLNVRQADDRLLEVLKALGQKRVTFAPETGASLRPSVGKSYSKDESLLSITELASRHGLGLDLYTMLGVPEEGLEHVRELAELIGATRKALNADLPLDVSVNPAFTKAQTPYERYATVRPSIARARFRYLRNSLPDGDNGIRWTTVINDAMCYYQPILSMGGPEVADVLDDVSTDYLPSKSQWRRAVQRHLGDDSRYFTPRPADSILPWQHIVFNDHDRLAVRFSGHRRRASRGSSCAANSNAVASDAAADI